MTLFDLNKIIEKVYKDNSDKDLWNDSLVIDREDFYLLLDFIDSNMNTNFVCRLKEEFKKSS